MFSYALTVNFFGKDAVGLDKFRPSTIIYQQHFPFPPTHHIIYNTYPWSNKYLGGQVSLPCKLRIQLSASWILIPIITIPLKRYFNQNSTLCGQGPVQRELRELLGGAGGGTAGRTHGQPRTGALTAFNFA